MSQNPPKDVVEVASHDLLSVFALYALDDSCQQMLYVEGHHPQDAVIRSCREYAPHAYIMDGQPVLHHWMRRRPIRGSVVADMACDFVTAPGRGAKPVTVLALWMPIHPLNANVDLPDTAAHDSASKSNSPAVSG